MRVSLLANVHHAPLCICHACQIVAAKTAFCLANGLNVMACVGEKLEEREAGKTMDVVNAQMEAIGGALSQHALRCLRARAIYCVLWRAYSSQRCGRITYTHTQTHTHTDARTHYLIA
jgi:hypothetical protein